MLSRLCGSCEKKIDLPITALNSRVTSIRTITILSISWPSLLGILCSVRTHFCNLRPTSVSLASDPSLLNYTFAGSVVADSCIVLHGSFFTVNNRKQTSYCQD